MTYYRLELFGHIHECPNRHVHSYHSWPKGKSWYEVKKLIDKFNTAFTLINWKASEKPRPTGR